MVHYFWGSSWEAASEAAFEAGIQNLAAFIIKLHAGRAAADHLAVLEGMRAETAVSTRRHCVLRV